VKGIHFALRKNIKALSNISLLCYRVRYGIDKFMKLYTSHVGSGLSFVADLRFRGSDKRFVPANGSSWFIFVTHLRF
jgi:hypothetical protein